MFLNVISDKIDLINTSKNIQVVGNGTKDFKCKKSQLKTGFINFLLLTLMTKELLK